MCESHKKIKTMLIIFLRSWSGALCVPKGQTSNAAFYVLVFKRARDHIRPELWVKMNWILHHNNAPSHMALINLSRKTILWTTLLIRTTNFFYSFKLSENCGVVSNAEKTLEKCTKHKMQNNEAPEGPTKE